MNRTATAVLALALAIGVTQAQGAPPAARQEVPVTTVALFSSGVGYFEHGGIVRGNGTAELRFRTSQMNDVLQTTQYYQRLLAKLNEQESSIERLQRERDDLIIKRDAARRELENYLRDLTIG